MRSPVGLDRHALTFQLLQIIPIADGFVRLTSRIKRVAPSDIVRRNKKNGGKPEPPQQGQGNRPHRAITIIERDQRRAARQALGVFQAFYKTALVNDLPAVRREISQLANKRVLGDIEPCAPRTARRLADFVEA